ncbi:hypothetical protein EDB84DRAFT_488802 [Lactarius hengduanensis]|nr:hypothetical protein EDB84DRAFT_488802 [Lactarius hengduanensis]
MMLLHRLDSSLTSVALDSTSSRSRSKLFSSQTFLSLAFCNIPPPSLSAQPPPRVDKRSAVPNDFLLLSTSKLNLGPSVPLSTPQIRVVSFHDVFFFSSSRVHLATTLNSNSLAPAVPKTAGVRVRHEASTSGATRAPMRQAHPSGHSATLASHCEGSGIKYLIMTRIL